MLTTDERDALAIARKLIAAGVAHCESSGLRTVATVSPRHAPAVAGLQAKIQTALDPNLTFGCRLWNHDQVTRTGAQHIAAMLLWLDIIIATGDVDVFNKETTPWKRK